MSEIQSYIEKLDIKKVPIGGFDKEAVYTSMQELSSMYQKEIIQLKAEKERLEAEVKTAADELIQAKKDIQLDRATGLSIRFSRIPKALGPCSDSSWYNSSAKYFSAGRFGGVGKRPSCQPQAFRGRRAAH